MGTCSQAMYSVLYPAIILCEVKYAVNKAGLIEFWCETQFEYTQYVIILEAMWYASLSWRMSLIHGIILLTLPTYPFKNRASLTSYTSHVCFIVQLTNSDQETKFPLQSFNCHSKDKNKSCIQNEVAKTSCKQSLYHAISETISAICSGNPPNTQFHCIMENQSLLSHSPCISYLYTALTAFC